MSQEQNIQAFRTVIEQAYSQGNLDVLDQVFADDFVERQAGIVPPTAEGVKRSILYLRGAMPDLTLTLEEIVASGDKTWARITARGTHQGPLMGLPPTGKSVVITVMDECRYENGRIVEHWGVADQFSLLAQIGGLPRPPQPRS
jgi:predicted ester cyclase